MHRSEVARVWRLIAVCAVAVPIVLAATSEVASAGTAAFAPAAATFKAVVSLSPSRAAVDQAVVGTVSKSTLPRGAKVKKITINWGDRTKTVTLASLKSKATHRYVLPGRYVVTLSITDQAKQTTRGDAVELVTVPGGSFTGTNPQTGQSSMTFYVSSTRTSLQDISIRDAIVTCTPGGGTFTEPVGIASVALKSNGSFGSTTTQHGDFDGYPATLTYLFKGDFAGLSSSGAVEVKGIFRVTLAYTSAAVYRCTSNDQSWTATRDIQPAQTGSPPPVGSYTGTNPQTGQSSVTFYVSSNKRALQDISIPDVIVACAPGDGTFTEPVGIASVAVKSNGSFTGTATQHGNFDGYPATFTYSFAGNFHSVGPTGAERAAGMFRETMSYTGLATYNCTSNNQSFTATRDSQPAQTPVAPPVGSYTGTNPQTGQSSITFYVSSNKRALQNISISDVIVACAPSAGTYTEPVGIASVAIASNGSFSSTTTQHGVFDGYAATFTYTFAGNFHSVAPSGAERAAGIFRETMTYTGTSAYSCTSNNRSFLATRDNQPAQTTAAPRLGTYTGTNPQTGQDSVSFDVTSGGLEDISVTDAIVTCSPGGHTLTEPLSIPSEMLVTSGWSFTGTAVMDGLVGSDPATFTYAFEGNFHSVGLSGAERAAGMFNVKVTYTGASAYTCTSNNQSWRATYS